MFEKGPLFEAKYCPHCKHELQVYVLREKTTCPFCGEEFLNKNAYDGIEKDIPYQLINNKKIIRVPIQSKEPESEKKENFYKKNIIAFSIGIILTFLICLSFAKNFIISEDVAFTYQAIEMKNREGNEN